MSKSLGVGDSAPDFSLFDGAGDKVDLKALAGQWVVLYFYPKDDTPGCTIEAMDFSKLRKEFEKAGALVFGVSPDSPESHCKFSERRHLKVRLLSDPTHKVLEAYGVWGLKKLYGREFMGVDRTTFLIDPTGKIAELWPKVKVAGHAEAVLKALEAHK